MATRAPSATNSRAVASPMPLLPPVINAVLFASRIVISVFLVALLNYVAIWSVWFHNATTQGCDRGTIRRMAMVKRTSLEQAECPVARSLDALGDWWSLLIIRDAMLGISRFGEFQKNIGLAKNILAVRLRTLVDQGILKTPPASDASAYQEYVLTPKGRRVFP